MLRLTIAFLFYSDYFRNERFMLPAESLFFHEIAQSDLPLLFLRGFNFCAEPLFLPFAGYGYPLFRISFHRSPAKHKGKALKSGPSLIGRLLLKESDYFIPLFIGKLRPCLHMHPYGHPLQMGERCRRRSVMTPLAIFGPELCAAFLS